MQPLFPVRLSGRGMADPLRTRGVDAIVVEHARARILQTANVVGGTRSDCRGTMGHLARICFYMSRGEALACDSGLIAWNRLSHRERQRDGDPGASLLHIGGSNRSGVGANHGIDKGQSQAMAR